MDETMTITPCENGARSGRRRLKANYSAACGALSAQRAIRVFDGSVSSTSFFAVASGVLLVRAGGGLHRLPPFRPEFGTIDSFGRELYTRGLVPFELATALFVVAVVGAISVARGRHKADAIKEEGT